MRAAEPITQVREGGRSARLVRNSLVGLARVLFSAFAGLVTVPMLLRNLGMNDYGLYAVVAGFVGLLSFFNGALAIGAQRHLSHAAAEGSEKIQRIFGNSFAVHISVALVVILLGELIGHWYIGRGLNAEPGRLETAGILLQTALATASIGIIVVPFQALLLAKEEMSIIAMGELGNSLGLLALAAALPAFSDHRVIYYGLGVVVVTLITSGFGVVVCLARHKNCCSFRLAYLQLNTASTLASFAAWNTVAALASMARTQGIALVLNALFGTAANAAYGVALRLASFHNAVTGSFRKAASAQIVEAEATGQRERGLLVAELVGKYSFYAAAIWVIPLMSEARFIFELWLHEPPPLAVEFSRLLLLTLTLELVTVGFITTVQAVGRIALYQLVVGVALILAVPATFAVGYLGVSAEYTLWAMVVMAIAAAIARMLFVRRLTGFKLNGWLRRTLFRAAIGVSPAIINALLVQTLFEANWYRFAISSVTTPVALLGGAWVLGFTAKERAFFFRQLQSRINQGGWGAKLLRGRSRAI